MRWHGGIVALALGILTGLAGAQGLPPPATRTELILLTGSESGIYYALGHDIKRLVDQVVPEVNIDLAVVPSRGALQNVVDVFRYASIQLGMTQSDVLAYLDLYARGDPEARRVVGGLQVVSHLYDEEVYLFARPGITGLADLTGKRVDVGAAGSGTTVSALVLMHLAGAEPRELAHHLETTEAIAALRRGQIDAFFRVTGTPAESLREGISASHGFALVPIRLHPKPEELPLAQNYTPTVIAAHVYPWLDHPVDTVKVRTVMMTSGAPPGSPVCEAIGRLARVIFENRGGWLRQQGHSEWRELDRRPADILADPRISPCVAAALRR